MALANLQANNVLARALTVTSAIPRTVQGKSTVVNLSITLAAAQTITLPGVLGNAGVQYVFVLSSRAAGGTMIVAAPAGVFMYGVLQNTAGATIAKAAAGATVTFLAAAAVGDTLMVTCDGNAYIVNGVSSAVGFA